MDTTYFGRTFGVMVFRDATTGTVLYRKYVKHETNQLYADGLKFPSWTRHGDKRRCL
ncbi:MAG: hypothetical protein IPI00_03750 [Flavobacteriales bacterium]|nr:hypothetical protein [Flavobacteriales bacterium]